MTFTEFNKALQENFDTKMREVDHLFVMDVSGDHLWNVYLDSFPAGTNNIFRVNREYDCSACRNFVKRFGNIVFIKDNKITSIWDFTAPDATFQTVINALNKCVIASRIKDVFVTRDKFIGNKCNYEQTGDGQVLTWSHLYVEIPNKFIYAGNKTLDTVIGDYRTVKEVFTRSLDEISMESVDTVLELISSNTLYRGEEWQGVLQEFKKYKIAYGKVSNKDAFVWEASVVAGPVIGKIRNHSIGVLLLDISNDIDLDNALKRYESVVAPSNYKRPNAIFTKKMLEDAKNTVESLGYMASLSRRFATLDDISVNNILFCNRDVSPRITGTSNMFDELETSIPVDPKKFSKIEEVALDKFIKDVLPTASEVEILLETKFSSSMVSLIAPAKADAPTMFKWDNAFSWAYTGNITDSTMKQNVKMAGGNVSGVLRFSIQWNDIKGKHNADDLDAHCIEPTGNEIYYAKKRGFASSGALDVDIIRPTVDQVAVENIVYTSKESMPKGKYQFFVHQFSNRGGQDGFTAEIEFDGQIYEFSYPHDLRQVRDVRVADVTFDGYTFTLEERLPATSSSREIWGLKSNQFIPVNVIMYSPNYWDEQDGIGHRHVFFMLKNCISPETPHGFYNEFLKRDLEVHKRVFEALGSKASVSFTDDQLSGCGFSTTRRASAIVKVKGNVERIIKVMI